MSLLPTRIRLAGWIALALLAFGLTPTAMAAGEIKTLVSLDADSTSVNDILEILARRSGLNIITSPEVQSRAITIHIKDTPFDEALNLVVRAAGLGYERVGSSILVADTQRLSVKTGLITRVFELSYARAEEVKEMLAVLTKDVAANPHDNRVVMKGTQSQIEEAERIIAVLDQKPIQVLLVARLIEVNTSEVMELGIDWEKLTKWSTIITENDQGSSTPGAMPADVGFLQAEDGGTFYRQASAFEVAIDALLTDGSARLLSNTKVVTLDGEPAEIFAGETVPVMISSLQSSAAAGAFQTVQLEKIDVGVRLNITPRVTDDGFITTLVEPEVSSILAFVGPDSDLPQTSTRRARTLVRVKDGEKIYLGGLLSEEERKTIKKVPLLGQIPLLGRLFQHHKTETEKLDLVIEITPHIVGDAGMTRPMAPDNSGLMGSK